VDDGETLGARYAKALSAKDRDALTALLAPQIDFKAITPSRYWEASDPSSVLETLLSDWFELSDEIEELQHLETGGFADRERVGYRFAVRNPEGRFIVEQQAYLAAADGHIAWMRVVCSGFRPVR
jgi:hypothetical protein